MNSTEIKKRIEEIDGEISDLEAEREGLEEQEKMANKWSQDAIQSRLRDMIERRYGKNHDVKVAIFRANSEYNDQGYDYRNPVLVLIDSKFNEVNHNLNLDGVLIPEDDEQYRYYEAMSEELLIEDFTMKF